MRDLNNRREIALVGRLRPLRGLRVLDVGAAHGWYLEAAVGEGALAEGIEPDAEIAESARARGLRVTTGYFPEAARGLPPFDVICFHDVLEHIADLSGALSACRALLVPGGLLVVSAPDARGALYATARLLAALRFFGPLERLWQVGYPSPHVSYFSRETLGRAASRLGFRWRADSPLASLALRGLWARVHMDRTPTAGSTVVYCALALARLLLASLPSDQRLYVFEAPGGGRGPDPDAATRQGEATGPKAGGAGPGAG